MGQIMGEIVQPIHHDGEQAVPVSRWGLMSFVECKHVLRGKWGELGVGCRSMPSEESQTIRRMCELVLLREIQDDMVGLGSGRVQQFGEQEIRACWALSRVSGVYAPS